MREDQRVAWTAELAWMEADGFGMVLAVNSRFTEEFGWSAESVVGTPLDRLIPEQFRDAHNLAFSRFVEFGRPNVLGQPLRLPLVTADGQAVMTETCIQARRGEDGWRFGAQFERLDPAGGGR
jgi:PAS domain S-box-containing protein